MALMTLGYAATAAAIFFILLLVRLAKASCRHRKMPPGPAGLPILGNVHQLPTSKAYLKFHKWAKEYGEIFSLKIGSGNMIVLNSADAVLELFDKRGAIYSHRPESYVSNELVCPGNTHLLLLDYSDTWRRQRKVYMSLLNMNVVRSLRPIQEAESNQTMKDLCETPDQFQHLIRRYSTNVILSSVYGHRGASFNDPRVKAIYKIQDQFSEILQPENTPPVDVFPILKYIPEFLADWKRRARDVREGQEELYMRLLNDAKARIARGKHVNCFMDRLLTQSEKNELDDHLIARIGGVMMEAGSDTTSSMLLSFILSMTKHPYILAKAQVEVDRVCGQERSPTFEDMDDLPYIRACVLETLRWRPAAPASFPHVSARDDWYNGYFIPKGSLVVSNVHTIHRSEEDYNDPLEYKPERYINNKLGTRAEVDQETKVGRRAVYTFGAGRRICPGIHLGESSLEINMAKLVWGFNFLPPLDPTTGLPVPLEEIDTDVETAYSDGITTHPNSYKCRVVPRSESHVEIMRKDWEGSASVFAQYTN